MSERLYNTILKIAIPFMIITMLPMLWYSNNRITHQQLVILSLEKNISQYHQLNIDMKKDNERLKKELNDKNAARVTLSFYHPKSKGINSDSDPSTTATMQKVVIGQTAAISNQLVSEGWLYKEIYIKGYGVFRADDKMGHTVKGRHIDIAVASLDEAYRKGKHQNILAVKRN